MRGVESQSGERIRAVWLGKLELEGPGPFFISVISYFNRKGNCGPGRRWDLLNAKSKCMETSGLDCAGPLTFGLDSLEPDERCFLGKMNECRKRSRDTYAAGDRSSLWSLTPCKVWAEGRPLPFTNAQAPLAANQGSKSRRNFGCLGNTDKASPPHQDQLE